MAVPKRKMSRSNTRSRRSQWKTSVPTLVTCPNRACGALTPPHQVVPDLRAVPRPPGRRGLTRPWAVRRRQPNNTPDPAVISAALGVELDGDLVVLALTHRSFAYENGGLPTNERLEFLGDSVLGVIITDVLYRTHPDLPEGRLAKLRASVVNMHALAGVGRRIGLGEQLRLGRGEELTGGRDKSSIVADAVEAVIGAVYLQHGLDVTRLVIHRLFGELLTAAPQLGAGLDWKTSLQELSAGRALGVPEYRVTEEGPDHAKMFAATVMLSGTAYGAGSGRTKKEAEQDAAAATYTSLQAATNGAAAAADQLVADRAVADGRHLDDRVLRQPRLSRRYRAIHATRRYRIRGQSTRVRPVPELPEVESVRRGLLSHLIGRRICRVQVFYRPGRSPSSGRRRRLRGHPAGPPRRRCAPAGQVPVVGAGRRRRRPRAPGDERAVPDHRAGRRGDRQPAGTGTRLRKRSVIRTCGSGSPSTTADPTSTSSTSARSAACPSRRAAPSCRPRSRTSPGTRSTRSSRWTPRSPRIRPQAHRDQTRAARPDAWCPGSATSTPTRRSGGPRCTTRGRPPP